MSRPKVKACFAVGLNGEFGNEGGLPWPHCKADMKHFKEYTDGFTLMMGETTFKTLPNVVKDRCDCVYLTEKGPLDFEVCKPPEAICQPKSVPDAIENELMCITHYELSSEGVCVIGGPKVILESLPAVDEISISFISDCNIVCDTVMDMEALSQSLKAFVRSSVVHHKREEGKDGELQPKCVTEIWVRKEEYL